MKETSKLLRSGKRYRGFLEVSGRFMPVTFNLYVINEQTLRVRYLFPTSLAKYLREGKVLYILLEEGTRNLIGEARVVKTEERGAVLSLDFLTEDRRKFPRVKVGGLVRVKALLRCGGEEIEGDVEDISFSSLSVKTGRDIKGRECELTLDYKGIRYSLMAKVIRSEGGITVLEISGGNHSFTEIFGKIFTELFLKAQREV